MRSVATRLKPRVREHNLTLVAAGVAFYAFLALVPALIAFMSVYGLVADPADVTRQVQDVASALPKEVQDFLVFQLTSITNTNRAGVSLTLVIAIALALWSASGGMAALITGIHVAHEHDEPKSVVARARQGAAAHDRRDGVPRRRDLRRRRPAAAALQGRPGHGRAHRGRDPAVADPGRGDGRGRRAALPAGPEALARVAGSAW